MNRFLTIVAVAVGMMLLLPSQAPAQAPPGPTVRHWWPRGPRRGKRPAAPPPWREHVVTTIVFFVGAALFAG